MEGKIKIQFFLTIDGWIKGVDTIKFEAISLTNGVKLSKGVRMGPSCPFLFLIIVERLSNLMKKPIAMVIAM
ncbi:hypothetical protein CR513_10171, partial [Mucuna pruriens]